MEDFWSQPVFLIILSLIYSFIVTWTIGLLPPLIIRYAMLRRHISRKWAWVFVIVFWIINLIVFELMGSHSTYHVALLLVGYVSYYIYRTSYSLKQILSFRPVFVTQLSLLLCFKYLYKRKIVLLSVVAVAMSCALLMVVSALFSGFINALEQSSKDTTGDIVISAPQRRRISQYDKLIAELELSAEVEAAGPLLASQGGLLYLGKGNVRGVFILGIDIVKCTKVTRFGESLLRQKESTDSPAFGLPDHPLDTGGFVGIGVITKPDEKTDEYDFETARSEYIGRKVSLTTASAASKKPRPVKFRISDIFHSGIYKLDKNAVYLPIDVLIEQLYPDEGKICDEIQIKLADGVDIASGLERVRNIWKSFSKDIYWGSFATVQTSTQKNVQLIVEYRKQMGMLMLIFGIVSGGIILLIFCIFYMIVLSKRKDIAITKSCGLGSCSIVGLFVGFGCVIGIAGSALGVVIGYYITININAVEGFISSMLGMKLWKSSTYMFTRIPNEVNWDSVVWIVIAAIAASVLGAIVPAIAAARVNPVKILRYE